MTNIIISLYNCKFLSTNVFLWMQSHKVRAPVASILGLVQLYDEDLFQKERREIVERIRTSSEILDDVIRETLRKTDTYEVPFRM
jgi:signal transduction histidine kinase